MTLSIGDKLYFVGNGNNSTREYVTVSKIGRKWITLANQRGRDEYRIGIHDLDGKDSCYADYPGNSNYGGQVYRTKEDYQIESERERLWDLVRSAAYCAYRVPDHLTIGDLREVARLLKIEDAK